jgi:hypothetical protein
MLVFPVTGRPVRGDSEEDRQNVAAARHLMADEAARTRAGFRHAPPPSQEQRGPPQMAPPQATYNNYSQAAEAQPQPPQHAVADNLYRNAECQEQPAGHGNWQAQAAADPRYFANAQQQQQHAIGGGGQMAISAQHIREMFPMVAHLPDEYLLSQSIDALFRLAREERTDTAKGLKGLEAKAHANQQRAAANPALVPEGRDSTGY